jgi:hypothetical protein
MPRTSVVAAAFLSLLAVTGCSKQSEAAGRGGTTLALSKPADQNITQGKSENVSISVDRHGFADAVQVSFSNLPTGVTVTEGTIPAGDSKKDFVLVAAPDAPAVNKHLVTVTARGAGAAPSQQFELTVKPR